MSEIVRQVDHVLIAAHSGPELLAIFTDKLQLETVWPWAVSAGNVSLEIFGYDSVSPEHPLRAGSRDLPWPGVESSGEPARVVGLALEPFPLEGALSEMDRRAIRYREPSRQYEPGNDDNLWWTIVGLPDVSTGVWVFLVEYSTSTFDQWAARAGPGRGHGGGTLGVLGVAEVAVGVADHPGSIARWEPVLAPAPSPERGSWRPGDGPTIRLVAAETPGIRHVTFAVASLDAARRFLSSERMLGDDNGHEVTIDRASVLGLDLRLIES